MIPKPSHSAGAVRFGLGRTDGYFFRQSREARQEQAVQCAACVECGAVATHKAVTIKGKVFGVCKAHRSIAQRVMADHTARYDLNYAANSAPERRKAKR